MSNSFIDNVNRIVEKLEIIVEANEIFDEGVIPILAEIAELDLVEAIHDLKKGNYLGNRKIDINLALNMVGVDQDLIDKDPDAAEAIWVDPAKRVSYDKATAYFTDGTVIELPFLFDQNPVSVSTHGDLLVQLTRLDYVYAQAQVDSIYQFTVADNEAYVVTIDNESFTYTSGVGSTRGTIIAGIANMINGESIPMTATVQETSLNITADVAGNPFFMTVSNNMQSNTITINIVEGPRETAFLAKLDNTLATNFAAPVVGEFVRLYDVLGSSSNLERLELRAVTGTYTDPKPMYFWANTTSAFQTLSMRAGDIIALGNEIDRLLPLSRSIEELIELQARIPQFVDRYDVDGNPLGDVTIYNSLSELNSIYAVLNEILVVYNDIRGAGNQYVNTVAADLQTNSYTGTVGSDLQSVNSKVTTVGTDLQAVDSKVTTVGADLQTVNSKVVQVGTDLQTVNYVSTVGTDLQNVESKVIEVGTDLQTTNYVGTVGTDLQTVDSKVIEVGTDLQLVNSPIKEVANNLQTTDTIGTVSGSIGNVNITAGSIGNVNLTGGSIGNVNTVAGSITNVNLTGGSITNVNTTAVNISKVNTVAGKILDVEIVADNIAAVLNAEGNANTATDQAVIATQQAVIATTQAGIATTKSNEIKAVTVGSTVTAVAGTPAAVSYNSSTGAFTFIVPQGFKGDRGDSFEIDYTGVLADRPIYNSVNKGSSFFATDLNLLYFKTEDTVGDFWTVGIEFGKGDKGDTGDTGVGIVSITFTDTTDISGLAGQSGGTDTYTILLSDSSNVTFNVYNGVDSEVTNVAGRVGEVVLVESDITDLDKYGVTEVDNMLDTYSTELKSYSVAMAIALS